MRTLPEYIMLLVAGAALSSLSLFLLGGRKRAAALAGINCLLGALNGFLPMAAGHYLPAWAGFACGALGAGGGFFFLPLAGFKAPFLFLFKNLELFLILLSENRRKAKGRKL